MILERDKYISKNDLATYIDAKIQAQKIITNTIIPGVIDVYDPKTNYATVQTMFQFTLKDGTPLIPPPLTEVPVAHFGGDDFCVTKKPKTGDNGLLLVSQRSLDEWKDFIEKGERPQPTQPKNKRMNNANDGIFIPLHFPKERDNGMLFKTPIEFKREFLPDFQIPAAISTIIGINTSITLFAIIDTIYGLIDSLSTAVLTLYTATNTAIQSLNVVAPGIGVAFTAATASVPIAIGKIKNDILAERGKLRLLLKS